MGNRVFLYLCTEVEAEQGGGRPFAEAKNHFPTLWQLLLADSREGPSNAAQRLAFLDTDTGNLIGDAAGARERFAILERYVVGHPRLDRIPGLGLQFEAFRRYFDEESALVRAGADRAGAPLKFSADLDELSWLDGDGEGFIERMAAQCGAFWGELQEAIAADHAERVAELLEVEGPAWHADEWSSWLWQFGFGGLDHPYFGQRERPRRIAFEAFEHDDYADQPELGHDRILFEAGGLRGLRRRGEYDEHDRLQAGETLIPPQWQDILDAGHEARELYWVAREDRYGLLERHADGRLQLLLEPMLSEVDEFQALGPCALAAVRIGERAGLLQDDGAWRLRPDAASPPAHDIGRFSHGRACARSGERYGYLDPAGQWCVAPAFDAGGEFTAAGHADVRRKGRVGLIDRHGTLVLEPQYDALEWHEEAGAYLARRGRQCGWLHADGRAWVGLEWDEIDAMPAGAAIRVRRKGRYGLLDWSGRECVAPLYRALDLDHETVDDAAPARREALRYLVRTAGRDGGLGMIDADGRELVPPVYDELAAFASWIEAGAGESADEHGEPWRTPQHLIALRREVAGRERRGAWDLRLGREVVPCAHDHVFAAALYRDGDEVVGGYLVAEDLPEDEDQGYGRQRMQVLRADGAVLHAGYAWIGVARLLDWSELSAIALHLYRTWSADRPVEAVRSDDDRFEWLRRDGRRHDHAEWLAAACSAGDRGAALRLARELRDGYGVDADPVAARLWMARAAGIEPHASARRPGLFARLFGAADAAWTPAGAAADASVDAMDELAAMLIDGVGGPAAPALARDWLERLLTLAPDHPRAQIRLGHLLQNGVGGDADAERALRLFERAAAQAEPDALYNLGHAHEFGLGTAIDHQRALDHYRRAAEVGDGDGAHRAGLVALRLGANAGADRAAACAEAARWLRRAAEHDSYAGAHVAGSDLAGLLARGEGVERDVDEAERLWLAAAEGGHRGSIEHLLALYGDEDSERHDPERAAYWRQRR